MKSFYKYIIIAAVTLALYGAACGGGTGGQAGEENQDASAPCAGSVDSYLTAMELLEAGDVQGARDNFSQALSCQDLGASYLMAKEDGATDITPEEAMTRSYFGRAFTNMLLVAASQPISDILTGFGQQPWSPGSVFTDDGWLGRAYAVNKADVDVTIHRESLDEPIERQIGRAYEYRHNFSSEGVGLGRHLEIGRASHNDAVYLMARFFNGFDLGVGVTSSGVCSVGEGDTVGPVDSCTLDDGSPEDRYLLDVRYGAYQIDRTLSEGSLTVDRIGTGTGDEVGVTFNDLTLYNGDGDMITISGSYSDTISENADIEYTGIPFADSCGLGWCILGKVGYGYSSGDAIAGAVQLQDALDGIVSDLESAVADPEARFDVPRGLFYGEHDMFVSRNDMLFTLSGAYLLKAGLNVLGSFTADIVLSSLADADGEFIGSEAAIVSQLNEFFELRPDNELQQARENMAAGLDYGIEAIDSLLADDSYLDYVSYDQFPLVLRSDNADQLMTELRELVVQVRDGMGGPSIVTSVDPSIEIDLDRLFSGDVDGAAIEYDPFVLEDGNIVPVEEYFVDLMGQVTSYDLHEAPRVKLLSQQVRDYWFMTRPWMFARAYNARFGGFRPTLGWN